MSKSDSYTMQNLDSDLLRTFLAVAETGSFTDASARIGRSQSATSLQIKRLETIIGRPVFRRHGRGVLLNPAGETLIPVAREVVGRLDGALADLTGQGLAGSIRLGIPDDRSQELLARVLADFAARHPDVELVVKCGSSALFPRDLAAGRLDLAVHDVEAVRPGQQILSEEATCWMASRQHAPDRNDPLPVALFDADCWWREAALASLRDGGRRYRVVFSSESVRGIVAAIASGIAVGLLGSSFACPSFQELGASAGLGPTPRSKLVLDYGSGFPTDAARSLAGTIMSAFAAISLSPAGR